MTIITEKLKIKYMNEIKNRKIVEHNDLITSIAKMDKTPLKIFELAVSCIDTNNPPKDNVIYLSKKELFSFFDVSDTNKHSRFKKAVKEMQKQAYFDIKEKKNKGFEFKSIIPIPTVSWNDYSDEVFVRFNPDIMPYLIDLKTNFTQFTLTDIMELDSKYSIVLYKWLSMNYNQFERYQFTNNRNQRQLNELKNPTISVSELRQMTDTESTYPRFRDFSRMVLDKAIGKITKSTHFNVTYDKIKKGRSVTDIQFHVENKEHWKNEEYKQEDVVAKLSFEQKQQLNNELFAKGVASPYTIRLLTNNLITGLDTINQETIIGLSKNVYPLYDELVKANGEKALTEHLGYIRDNMIDYTASKKNIVKYLQISAQQYLDNGVGSIVEENKKQRLEEKKATRKKQVKEVPEWTNANYVETTTDDEKARFAEWQKKMKDSI